MDNNNKPSIRIDWFDGSVIEDAKPPSASQFVDEEDVEPETERKPAQTERKPIGFKRLLDISFMEPDLLSLEVAHRPGFWNLFDQEELKGDYIVLIVKILSALYRGIPKSTTKLAGLLETRFLGSNFLEKVTDYVYMLPNVRIVEKRMNALLWDDVDNFFVQVANLCDLCISYYSRSKSKKAIFKRIEKLLKVLHESANGVIKEHSETIREDVLERIVFLQTELEKNNVLAPQNIVSDSELSGSFKHLNIFPTKHDLITTNLACKPAILPNIKYGAYPSVEYYLDVQFKLLREDYFAPLREGICKYLKDPSKRRHENIRVHTRVRVIGTYVSNNKVGHLIDLAWEGRSNSQSVKTKLFNKQLMFGSLLLFTSDEFHTILCATVLDSSLELLREGYLAVSFQNPVSRNILSESFLMVESEVFFEPYHRVLKVLQDSTLDSLPMQKYIVYVKPETQPPVYLTSETLYTIEAPDKTEIPYPVLDTNQWPTKEFGLDDSQLEAFKFALTREFAVIQGPPGTGKTFIGIKIASTLLKNLSLEGTPMLIICYTNHALDQFLEGVLGVTGSVVRLGSQSKSERLERYNLNSVRAKIKCKYSYLYASKRAELEKIYKEIIDLQTEIEKCEQGIMCYKHIKPYLKINGKEYELKDSVEDSVLNWLFGSENDTNISQKQNDLVVEDTWENLEDLDVKDDKIETCFTEKWALNEMDSLSNIIKHVDVNKESFSNLDAVRKLETEIIKIKKRLDMFKNKLVLYKNRKEEKKMNKVIDLYVLSVEERWQFYFSIVREIKNELLSKMDRLLDKHNIANGELEEVSTLIDSEVIRTARVVGVTTTTAARRHQLIKKMKSPIVIVEEASEVLEAHIVASLTFECQHLILIGDHQQLRPTNAHYALTKHHNIDVSLFERMIRNGIHARTLSTQRRMRPNFAALLVPEIYERLDSHATVMSYPDIKGMRDNLYFVCHEVFEDSEGTDDSWSHQNTFEAEWCVSLAQYLIGNGYTPQDITILTTYNGQVSLIKKISYKSESLRDIKITAVDNFQGEESRIVILSLVRSNREGKIGFISDLHRICVALSRAKEGFYIFGNIKMLSQASPMWMCVYKKLIAQGAIGEQIYAISSKGEEIISIS